MLAFPELKKIILADGGNVVMADTVEQGLALLVSGDRGQPQPGSVLGSEAPPGLDELDRMQKAVAGLDAAVDDLQEALEELRETLGGSQP